MDQQLLFFNGIDGVEGWYGLEPMTDEALSAHVLGLHLRVPRERNVLENALRRGNTDTILRIVRLLAESSVEDAQRDAIWHEKWVARVARELSQGLLGEDYAGPNHLAELEGRLAHDTVDKIVRIVELIARDRVQELATLLLRDRDEAPDNLPVLRAKLSQDARNKLSEAEKMLRDADRAEHLARDAAARSAVLDSLISYLEVIPMDAVNIANRGRVSTLKLLDRRLDAVATGRPEPSPTLEAMRAALRALPTYTRWHDLLEMLREGLGPLVEQEGDLALWHDLVLALEQWLAQVGAQLAAVRGVVEEVDPTDLAQAGWGVIFPYEDPYRVPRIPGIKHALEPLLQLRRSQAGEYFKVYEKAGGYRPNETASRFVSRHGARVSDPADPRKLPYYLLLVGSPAEIPYHFQYQLDVQYAVGRIDFGDNLVAYANYASSVVAVESGAARPASKVTLFGVSHPDDRATRSSADHLVQPLYERLRKRHGARWQIDAVLRDEAKKARLMGLLGGEETPALLFAACHGMEFPKHDPLGRQVRHQGALLCQDWRGPEAERGEIPRHYYLAGEDLMSNTRMQGMIAFFFACYSAGTPRYDEYTKQAFRERGEAIAEQPFTAALPRVMLSLPEGALAVVGHVDRVWGTSYLGARQSEQIAVFASAMERLLKGHPIGSAMEYFNARYAALSTELTAILEDARWQRPDPYEVAEKWTSNNDARGYVVIGDPAVRLAQTMSSWER